MKKTAVKDTAEETTAITERGPSNVVFLRPTISLGRRLTRSGGEWRAQVAGAEVVVDRDPSVDESLLEEARESGAVVVLEGTTDRLTVVGVLMTSRALTIDAEGSVRASVNRFEIDARERVLLKTSRAFLEVAPEQVEVYARRVVTKARDVARTIAALIELN